MFLQSAYVVICSLCCFQLMSIQAYPLLMMPRLFGEYTDPIEDGRYKKSDLSFPQVEIEDDVLELEHLKRQQNGKAGTEHQREEVEELLPELERQLETATPTLTTSTPAINLASVAESTAGQPEKEQPEQGVHRPPMLPHQEDGNANSNKNGQQQQSPISDFGAGNAGGNAASPLAPSMAKAFYGAARLAFGQNPEMLPTSISSTTIPTTATTSTLAPTHNNETIGLETNDTITLYLTSTKSPAAEASTVNSAATTTLAPATITTASVTLTTTDVKRAMRAQRTQMKSPKQYVTNRDKEQKNNNEEINKETIGDVTLHDDLEVIKPTARRSVSHQQHVMSPKTADKLLRHGDGQYSSFDMAQYVFWTGDESGVARAVEEFIEQGLMSRENALKFLRDIRLGIEYLERSYSNRAFPEEIRQNHVKKSHVPIATTTTTTSTTERPQSYVHLERNIDGFNDAHLSKAIDSISVWSKLQELNNDARPDMADYDDTEGRAKVAEYLYTEYTLEEILYKLAKVMFTQSLAHGSDEAQHELQKLTDFLEREGNQGIIPMDLQKKILNVLLSALSDTLNDHPELLPAARVNLANPYINRVPIRVYGSLN